jgi:hypothetical protein
MTSYIAAKFCLVMLIIFHNSVTLYILLIVFCILFYATSNIIFIDF